MKKIAILIIDFYKMFISSLFRPILGEGCRFNPTCSEFTKDAISRFGVIKGTQLGIERLSRCRP